jgi:hypothetical protein
MPFGEGRQPHHLLGDVGALVFWSVALFVFGLLSLGLGALSSVVHMRASVSMLADLRARLIGSGTTVVAARPARGQVSVWPSVHEGVFAVQGDARCGPAQHSHLGPDRWYGACPSVDQRNDIAGASVAAAHFNFTGKLATALAGGQTISELEAWLQSTADWTGRERRVAV